MRLAVVGALALLASACASHRAPAASSPGTPATIVGQTLESWDPRLSSALALLAVNPTAAQHTLVAIEYRRVGVLDMAFSHFTTAARLI